MNVKGSVDTVNVAFSGDKIEMLRAISFEVRKVPYGDSELEATALTQLARLVPANNIKPKMSAQTDNKGIGRAAFCQANLICLSLGALHKFRMFLHAMGAKLILRMAVSD